MPQTYDSDDCRLEMEAELATARDDLAAEIKAHKRTAKSLAWYRDRVDMLQREQSRMRDPERTLVCSALFGELAEKQRADQLGINCRWLVAQLDEIHEALCPGHIGTWQDRAQKAVEAAKIISQNNALCVKKRRKCHPRHAWPMASIAAKSCGRSRASKKV
jgi:hypothetical protein